MKKNPEAAMAVIAAIFVLFSAMINPIFSVGLSVGLLCGFAAYYARKEEMIIYDWLLNG